MGNTTSSYDFHIHSKYSYDSLLSPERIIKVAEKRNLKGIAITDHNTIAGAIKALKCKSTLQIVVGAEIKTESGEIMGLFLNDEIGSYSFDEVIDEIRAQDGIVVLPHPYKKGGNPSSDIVSKVDLIEVLNGRRSPELNAKARILAKNSGKPIIGGSDAHLSFEIGKIRTVFNEDINDPNELRELLLRNSASVVGIESPQYVHYPSVFIGTIKTRNFKGLWNSIKNRF